MTAPAIDLSGEKSAIEELQAHLARKNHHATVVERLRAEAVAAEKAKTIALGIHDAAGDVVAVGAAIQTRDAAVQAVNVAEEVATAMELRAAELRKAALDAKAQAHAPLMRHAASEAVAACQDAAEAIAAHGRAVVRYERAAECARKASAAGLTPPYSDGAHIQLRHWHFSHPVRQELSKVLRAPQDEAAIWGTYAP